MSLIGVMTLNTTSFAQDLKDARRANRTAENAAIDAQIGQMLKSQSFTFVATEIYSTMSPGLNNIQLSALYGLWVTPQQFKAYLPIYGPGNFNGQPTLLRRMDFFTPNYTYKLESVNDGSYNVTITAMDTWSINTYTFLLMVPANGQFARLTVSTPFKANVSFEGNIQTM